jgi:ATP synthase protein I
MQYLALGIQIATFMVGGTLVGIGLGYLADKYLGMYPWGVIAGVILGVIAGAVGVVQIINKSQK